MKNKISFTSIMHIYMNKKNESSFPSLALAELARKYTLNLIGYRKLPGRELCLICIQQNTSFAFSAKVVLCFCRKLSHACQNILFRDGISANT